jgi:hypothetical protein
MPTITYPFKQLEYMAPRGPACFCLASLWCRAMLEAKKDGWGAPTNSGAERCSTFSVPGTKNRVAQEQAVFKAKQARLRENRRENRNLGEVGGQAAFILLEKGYALPDDALSLIDALNLVAKSVTDAGVTNVTKTIEQFGLVCGVRTNDVPWGSITNAVPFQTACVVWFSTGDKKQHAIGIYQTYGWKSTDFYVFEPNFGEYWCEGESDCGSLLSTFRAQPAYNNPDKATVQVVRLAQR